MPVENEEINAVITEIFQSNANLSLREQSEMAKLMIRLGQEQIRHIESCVPDLPKPGDDYPKFPGKKNADPYEWLRIHWGQWLKHFNADLPRDFLSSQMLGDLDLPLKNCLYAERDTLGPNNDLRVSDILPSKTEVINQELAYLEIIPSEDLRRLGAVLSARAARAPSNE